MAIKSIIYIFIIYLVSGCATIFSGKTQNVTINSFPAGATVKVSGRVVGKTPIILALNRKGYSPITLELAGYEKAYVPVRKGFNNMFWANILFIYGSSTDVTTGATGEYEPSSYRVSMKALPAKVIPLPKREVKAQQELEKEIRAKEKKSSSADNYVRPDFEVQAGPSLDVNY